MSVIVQFKAKLFKNGDTRSSKALFNVLLSFLFKGGGVLINIVLVPLTIGFVNVEEYGIWLTLSSIMAWLSVSDIGLGHGLRNKFAEALALNDKKLARIYVSTTYVSLLFFVAVLWMVFIVVNNFIDWSKVLNVGANLSSELSSTVLIFFTFFSVHFVIKIIGTVLNASQMPGKAASFVFFSNLIVLIVIYVLKESGYNGSLPLLAMVTGASQVLVFLLASIWFYLGPLKEFVPSLKLFDRKYVKELLNLGLKFFLIQMSMIFIFQCTNIIISQVLDIEQVTIYNVAYRYFMIPMSFIMILLSPLWSAFTDAYVKKDFVWMNKIFRLLFFFTIGVAIILFLFLLVSKWLYKLWLGATLEIPFSVSLVMMLNILFATVFNIYIFIINGIGKLYLQIRLNILLSFIYIPLAIVFGKKYGLEGIITANLLVNLVYAVFIPIQSWKIIKQKEHGIWAR